MSIRIIGGSFSNNGRAGISVPSGADVEIRDVDISGNGVHGVEIRDPITDFLGSLPAGLPPEFLIEALQTLGGTPASSPAAQVQALKGSRLAEWLGRALDAASSASAVLQGVVAAHGAGLTIAAAKAFFGIG